MKGLVFGLTLDRAQEKMDKIIEDYEFYWNIKPKKICSNRSGYSVIFENNDTWYAGSFFEGQRGRKANIIYVDRDLSINDMEIIKCCLINVPYGAINYYQAKNN